MLKKLMPQFIKKRIKRVLFYKYNKPVLIALKNCVGQKRLILLLIPTHGNLGDQAISCCEHMFLIDNFADYVVVEIPDICWEYEKKKVMSCIKKDDCLLIHGGGFLGDLWEECEQQLREIVRAFPENRILVLPQSVFFGDNEHGREQANVSSHIYTMHPHLFLCVREKNSYECVKRNLLIRDMNNCFLMPDIVTYYEGDLSKYIRSDKVLLCLRSDKEKSIEAEFINSIESELADAGLEFSYTDTVVPYRIFPDRRNEEVSKKIQEFAQCKFVITDRLHGMLLSAISGTPCLFMDNCSKKVSGTYEWIKNLEYIKPLKDIDSLKTFISQLEDGQEYHYTNEHLQPYYDKLVDIIKKR